MIDCVESAVNQREREKRERERERERERGLHKNPSSRINSEKRKSVIEREGKIERD